MKLGAEDKRKTAAAGILGLVALGTVYVQFFTGAPGPPPRRPAPATKAAAAEVRPTRQAQRSAPATNRSGDFEPVWSRLSEDPNFDPVETDPTLRTDLLAAVRGVEFERVERNLFAFTDRKRKPEPGPTPEEQAAAQALIDQQQKQQKVVPPSAPPPPVKPRAPKLTWKYYGFAAESTKANRRAFLLDGEDVMIGAEGDIFKDRYKIVRIGLTSIVIEDIQFKAEQTLAITYQPG